jgi:two-component system, chemotaxis family, CheB/CheR fusion protein
MAKKKVPSKRTDVARRLTKKLAAPEAEPSAHGNTLPFEARPPKAFPIVGIGASAGGLAAFEAFLSAMPPTTDRGIAFVLVQHLSPDHKSILCELIRRYTKMQVYEVEDGMPVKPGCAYVLPPNRDIALLGGKLQLLEPAAARGVRLPIDFFFRSLAADQRDRAICIVLSGTGSDGTLGVRAVKGEGGMAMAQTPASTEFDSMPRSAIATGVVDYVLPPAEMPAQLIAFVEQIFGKKMKRPAPPPQKSQDTLAKICVLLRAKTGHDFSQYKENTLTRRVERRMALHQIERAGDYLRFMQQDGSEAHALFRDLLIGVTSFFRDDDAFAALENAAIPRLFEGVAPGGAIRVWVCGCSTGEEAYSIAILIQEHLEKLLQVYKVQIFATDIDRYATDQARTGVFPASIAADVTAERLARFFTQDSGGSFRVHKAIRDLLIFSELDVLKDPPFSKLGLLSCRNLLIYLNADLQKRLMPLFHYALKPGGMLFLGNSETIGDQPWLFEAIDRKTRLYVRKDDVSGAPRPQIGGLSGDAVMAATSANEGTHEVKLNVREVTQQTLLRNLTHAAVLVNVHGEILYYHGRTGNYLEPAPGNAGQNVLSMAREGLRRDLTSALHRAAAKKEAVHSDGIQVKANGGFITVNVGVLPAGTVAMPDLYLVTLDEKPPPATARSSKAGKPAAPAAVARIAALEHELRAKDEYIQTVVEEMDTSSEELKSSNEEMQSINEEMQSTNEELETSKEELQSVNEELATVNAELQQKVADLSRVNNDMNNLLAGTGVGTLFVDHQLRIARFTPTTTQVVNLIQSDIGRPLAHIVSNLIGHDNLLADVQSVLDTLVAMETEVQTKAGGWYILGIRPYRTLENVIEGVVITFVDITLRKRAEQKLLEAERFRRAAEIETVGIVFFKIDGAITAANGAFLRMIGYSEEELAGGKIHWEAITPPEWMKAYNTALEELKDSGRASPYEKQYIRKDGSRGLALFAAWRLAEGEAVVYIIEISKKKSAQSG